MPAFHRSIALGLAALALSAAPATADTSPTEGATVTILGPVGDYPTLTRGRVVLINAQRLVVTEEPAPVARVAEAPPEPQVVESEGNRPSAPSAGSVWVPGHWTHGVSGFSWVAGRYVAPRPGHIFVPPRWATLDDQHLHFTGFFVPRGVFVRSHFNRYYYSGDPRTGSRAAHGPYWPVGAPNPANSSSATASARDPYWPVGLR